MAVPEQTPYIEHTGNGVTTSFALKFQCESKDHLIVLIDDIEPPIATWSLTGGNVVFTTAPASGKKITLQRNTPFGRTADYQSFNNSFRPQTVNGDFDRLWLKLQELGVADWLMKLYVDRLHQQQETKINDLKDYVDDRDDELQSYLLEEIRKQGVALDQLDEYYNYLMQRLAQIAVDKGWDSSFVVHKGQSQYEINEDFFKKKWEKVSIKDFGAKGDGNQTLFDTSYQSDSVSQPTTITQQTADGLAINKAIKWLRHRGGGALYVPPCEDGNSYRVHGYLERIDFPCLIYGAGASSLIQNCDNSPTDKNGYGIFHIEAANVSEVTFMNFKIDGNAHVRTKPTSEWRSYNIHVRGKPRFRLFNMDSINAPIDCFCTRYLRPHELLDGEVVWVKALNCHFEDAYRNTLSLVAGNDIEFTNCTILGGGFVHGGTNPRYCLDIEPTSGDPRFHARNIRFVNCDFARAINAVIGGTWGQCDFIGCTIDASYEHPLNIDKPGYPWAFTLSSIGDWALKSCKVIGKPDKKVTLCTHYNAHDLISDLAENGGLKLFDTEFEFCGFQGNGRRIEIDNVTFKNSLSPIVFRKGTQVPQSDIHIRELKLINVFEGAGTTGSGSSFSINNSNVGNVDIDGLKITVDAAMLRKKFTPAEFTREGNYFGIAVNAGLNNCAANGFLARASNVHIEGYYQRLQAFTPAAGSGGRDWESPNPPPANTDLVLSSVAGTLNSAQVTGTVADTLVTGTVTNRTVTGSATQNNLIASRTLGGRTVATWKDCTMWGNYS